MTISDTDISQGKWSKDSVHALGAWIILRTASYQKIPDLKKPCSRGLGGGFPRNTRGENRDIYSMEARSSEHPQLEGAAKKSTTYRKLGKSAPRRLRKKRRLSR